MKNKKIEALKFSIIIPVFNRPDEVDELLESLSNQTQKDFEVIIVEDGSVKTCKDVCDKYADILALHYYAKENSGPGQSRNYGAKRANGEWLIILDSDVVLPKGYLAAVERQMDSGQWTVDSYDNQTSTEASAITAEANETSEKQNGMRGNHRSALPLGSSKNCPLSTLNSQLLAAFGGPDAAHPSFTPVQKAISYSMTSFFTTGGIRGGKTKLDKFYPRSFNMGIRRDVYLQLGGFTKMRFGEDIDFSYRIVEAGYRPQLFPEAWVWHKRRTDFRKFFRQVYNSGIARINLEKRHPGTMKLVHLLPTVFTVGVIGLVLCSLLSLLSPLTSSLSLLFLIPILLYSGIIFIDSSIRNRSLWVGILSIPAAFVQLMGYGLGFIESWWKRCILKQDEFQAFEQNFYS